MQPLANRLLTPLLAWLIVMIFPPYATPQGVGGIGGGFTNKHFQAKKETPKPPTPPGT